MNPFKGKVVLCACRRSREEIARRKAEERAKREEEAQRQAEEKRRKEEEERRLEEERAQREREEAERLQKQVYTNRIYNHIHSSQHTDQ